jgi:hypothetical protein
MQFTTKFGAREELAHPRGNRVRAVRELFRFDGFGGRHVTILGGLMTNQEVAKKDARWCLNGGLIYRRIALASETPSNIFAGRMSFSNIFFEPLP